jgi:hypothetical protein
MEASNIPEAQKKKARQVRSNVKELLFFFFNYWGLSSSLCSLAQETLAVGCTQLAAVSLKHPSSFITLVERFLAKHSIPQVC